MWGGPLREGALRERVRGTQAHACCRTAPAGGVGAVSLERSGTERRTARGAAERRRGPWRMRAEGTGRGKGNARSGACWAEHAERGSWASSWVGLLWVGLVSCFLSSSTLFLKQQTKFEFKYNFEFKPHSNN